MSEVIGFAGHAGAGKTAAALLAHDIVQPNDGRHIEFSDSIIAIANEWIEKSDATPDKSESLHVLSEVMAARCGADPKRFVALEYALPTMLSSAGKNVGPITAENKSDFGTYWNGWVRPVLNALVQQFGLILSSGRYKINFTKGWI